MGTSALTLAVPPIEHDCLCIDRIRRELVTDQIGSQIYLFWQLGSTSKGLRALADSGAREGTVVLAEAQSARLAGSGGRWPLPPSDLHASVLLRPAIPAPEVRLFALIASLALCDAIWTEGVRAAVQWPNDVLVDGRTVAGMGVTYTVRDGSVQYVILGMDVNLNTDQATFDAELDGTTDRPISLREAAGRPIDRNRFTAALLNLLEKWMTTYRKHGAHVVLEAWRARHVLTGRPVEIRGLGAAYRARVLGVNRHGALVVEDGRGATREVFSGGVHVVG